MEEWPHLSLLAPTILITIFALFMSIPCIIIGLITRKGDDSKRQLAGGMKTAPDAGVHGPYSATSTSWAVPLCQLGPGLDGRQVWPDLDHQVGSP
ncbi:hypothetical protein CRG98_040490 [Punica granatum]|uniref:Uncharacterized protein n=1 Tax=Punica granatum TaxID=22663 RepID=A0A2I0I544_PUNGR|nr:hypothetical protein CRG98_040490 [Punica granatum]